jgi:hypothetical protein
MWCLCSLLGGKLGSLGGIGNRIKMALGYKFVCVNTLSIFFYRYPVYQLWLQDLYHFNNCLN